MNKRAIQRGRINRIAFDAATGKYKREREVIEVLIPNTDDPPRAPAVPRLTAPGLSFVVPKS